MPIFIYQISLLLYRISANVFSLFSAKARFFVKGHRHAVDKIEKAMQGNKSPIAWFHCASLGEFEQGRPIIEKFKETFPAYKILLTFFSPSGYEVMKDYDRAGFIFYLPWDTKSNARKLIEIVNPSIAIFVKYEFWHFFINELKAKQIPILSTSSIFRPDQIYFKPFGHFNLNILKNVTHFFVQNRASKTLLEKHGITQVNIAGDTRFDRVAKIVNNRKDLPLVNQFKSDKKVMVVGSCWPEDLDVLITFINASDMRFIIAPHEIEGSCIEQIQEESMKKTILYSELEQLKGDEDVLIVDNVGLLSSLYGYGEYAFVGGAFKAGLHNILEAATYGVPIFFGNRNYQKFNEAVDLINLGGAVAIGSYTELRDQFNIFTQDTSLQIAGQVNRDYVLDNTGATEKIISYCKNILPQ
jgi:3-deoxy-D-manno-octulosonic-acid transferase